MRKVMSSTKLSVMIALILIAIVGLPIAAIESINVLFPYNMIELNFQTWLSALFLISMFCPPRRSL